MREYAVSMALDWMDFEEELFNSCVTQAQEIISRHPDHTFYAVALDGLYGEETGAVTLPALALNSEQAYARDYPDDTETGLLSPRWNAPDWHWCGLDIFDDDAAAAWEARLTEEAGRIGWEALEQDIFALLVRVCHRLRAELAVGRHEKLVVFVGDGDFEEELLRACLSEHDLALHFPDILSAEKEREHVRALPPAERAEYLLRSLRDPATHIERMEAAAGLRGLGDDAVPALLPLLADEENGWEAACLLGEVGVASREVVAALAERVRNADGPNKFWAARALAFLGQLPKVRGLNPDEETLVEAEAAPYTAFRDRCIHPRALDYAPLEQFLTERPDLAEALAKALAPGTGYCSITAAEEPVATAALGSRFDLVRMHAETVLQNYATATPR